jgi:6,7-dimethyl-8-ribityllumazine synthase
MSTANQSLSSYQANELPNAELYKFGIVVAEWNHEITNALLQGATLVLLEAQVIPKNIIQLNVPGSFELTAGASFLADKNLDAIICLGCVIQGETKHFDFICHAVAQGLTQLTVKHNIPFIFGVLTTDNMQQAIDRSGGKYGNKGVEAAVTALKMIAVKNKLTA